MDSIVLSLTAKGLTSGEISAHLAENHHASVAKETINQITDQITDVMVEWQNRLLDHVSGELERPWAPPKRRRYLRPSR